MAKCDLYRQPIRCSWPCDSSKECSYFVGLSLAPGLHHHADCLTEKLWGVFQWITVWMSASQLVSDVVPVGVKHCNLHPTSLLWKFLPRPCFQSVLWIKTHCRELKKYISKINCDISWEINSPSVTYGHRKSVLKFVCLFNCVRSNLSEILGSW